jgi:hypothetical protein
VLACGYGSTTREAVDRRTAVWDKPLAKTEDPTWQITKAIKSWCVALALEPEFKSQHCQRSNYYYAWNAEKKYTWQ